MRTEKDRHNCPFCKAEMWIATYGKEWNEVFVEKKAVMTVVQAMERIDSLLKDVKLLAEHCSALEVALKTGDYEKATLSFIRLPNHLQRAIDVR